MPIHATKKDIYTRGGLFDEMMSSCFDAAVLMDTNLDIIHHSDGAVELCNGLTSEEARGKSIRELDPVSDFDGVIKSGKPKYYSFAIIFGHRCVQHIIPIFSGDEIIGVLGGILFKNFSVLKKILSALVDTKDEYHVLYDRISRLEPNYTFDDFIGQSPALIKVLDKCRRLAPLKHSVMIIGETGTGKEILANGIHAAGSGDTGAPLIKINCSAIPGELLESELFGHEKGAFTGAVSRKIGKFELAKDGSILLDEIGEMDLKIQAKLLRVIEEREFERVGGISLIPLKARIIASTNKNLQALCQQGAFRSDLYYRLCTFEVVVPPLREHKEDIPLLLHHFMSSSGLQLSFSPEAINLILHYDWPGNVRQLRNMVNSLDILTDQKIVEADDIREILKLSPAESQPERGQNHYGHFSLMQDNEKDHILQILQESDMNVAKASRELKITRRTLYNKIIKYGIKLSRHNPAH